jgi:rare lipoprotein A
LDNGKSTVVRINDRGPFVRGRVIDCSYSAGKALGLDKSGIAKVKLEVVGFAGELEYPRVKSKSKKDSKKHIKSVKLSNFGVQVGAFSSYSSAKRVASKYNKKYPTNRTIVKKFDTSKGVIYRVWMMGFESREKAIDFRDCNGIDGSIVRL